MFNSNERAIRTEFLIISFSSELGLGTARQGSTGARQVRMLVQSEDTFKLSIHIDFCNPAYLT